MLFKRKRTPFPISNDAREKPLPIVTIYGIAVVNKFDKNKYAWFLLERNHNFIKLDERYEPTGYEFHNGHLLVKINDGENEKYAFINKNAENVFSTDFD